MPYISQVERIQIKAGKRPRTLGSSITASRWRFARIRIPNLKFHEYVNVLTDICRKYIGDAPAIRYQNSSMM